MAEKHEFVLEEHIACSITSLLTAWTCPFSNLCTTVNATAGTAGVPACTITHQAPGVKEGQAGTLRTQQVGTPRARWLTKD